MAHGHSLAVAAAAATIVGRYSGAPRLTAVAVAAAGGGDGRTRPFVCFPTTNTPLLPFISTSVRVRARTGARAQNDTRTTDANDDRIKFIIFYYYYYN